MKKNIIFVSNTAEEEQSIVDRFHDSVDFFKRHQIRFNMPRRAILEEYDSSLYEAYRAVAEADWANRSENFIEKLRLFFQRPEPFQFIVRITQYGPFGFYDFKDQSVTINRHANIDAFRIIQHEMIHVMVEPYILAQKLKHSQKEFIVESLGTMFASIDSISDPGK
ncbi:MAG: hypothetical protein ABIB04_00510 [Patescibacteria group bacterium]